MKVYWTNALPLYWVVEDEAGQRYLVSPTVDGWSRRQPYQGNLSLTPFSSLQAERVTLLTIGAVSQHEGR